MTREKEREVRNERERKNKMEEGRKQRRKEGRKKRNLSLRVTEGKVTNRGRKEGKRKTGEEGR